MWSQRPNASSRLRSSNGPRSLHRGLVSLIDQLLEKRSVMNRGLAQFFPAGLHLPNGDFVRISVVFENQRMILGDVGCRLFKVTDRIASDGHHVPQQQIHFCNRTGGAVDEASRGSAPGLFKARPIGCREGTDVKSLNSLGALVEFGFRVPPVTVLIWGASIFGAAGKSAQSFAPVFSMHEKSDDAGHE